MASIRRKQVSLKWLLSGLLIAMILLAYIPSMRGGFIWDDDLHVTNNSLLRTVDGLRRIWIEPGSWPQYYPLTLTSFWAEYQLRGLQPFSYHFVNVLLHALNAVLLWLVLRRLRVPGAWMGAAIFALHPVHVESVAWITERKNVLSGFFYLSALLVFLRFSLLDNDLPDMRPYPGRYSLASSTHRRLGLYLLAVSLYACALLSKTVTCSLPAAIMLLLWWKRDRVDWRDVRALIPLFILGAVSGMTTVWMEKQYVGAQGVEWTLSFAERCLVAGKALWFYAGQLIWPHKLTFIYPRWQIDSGIWWQYLFPLAAVAVVFSLWFIRRRIGKAPLVAVLFFGGTLVPALGFFDIFPMRYSFVADHFQYLASMGLIALCVPVIKMICGQVGPRGRRVEYGLYVAVLVILGALVWHEGHKYKDRETLWRDTLTKNPDCWLAHNNLGNALLKRGRIAEAINHFSQATRIEPDYVEAQYNLGIALAEQGEMAQAISHYYVALRINPYFKAAHNNLGLALEKRGRMTEAIRHYSEALQIDPDFVEAHNNLGLALEKQGKMAEAVSHYTEALRINPDFVEAHVNLGVALVAQGRLNEAIIHYYEALRINPDSVEAHNNLGNALIAQGRLDEAINHYYEALRINPDSVEAHNNLKKALAALGKIDGAIAKTQEALRLNPGDPALYYKLGNLYQTKGDLDGAIDQYQKALSIQPRFIGAVSNLAIVYTIKREYEKAISLFKDIIGLRPDSAGAYYNIACLYARQNRIEESIDWLKKAIERGYSNWDLIKTDKDLENIRGSSYYKDIIRGH